MKPEDITTEHLKTIYERAVQYAMAKANDGEPTTIILQDDGTINAQWKKYSRGDSWNENEYFGVEFLTADLDKVSEERKEVERLAKIERDKENAARQERDRIRKEQEERAKLTELKKKYPDAI